MTIAIDPTDARHHLGLAEMDMTHLEFIELVNRLVDADKPSFMRLFAELIEHTDRHFTAENTLMRKSGFPAIGEHTDEHQRVLGEMVRIGRKLASGSVLFGRAYVNERLPGWFALHAMTMDSALAAHLKAGASQTAEMSGPLTKAKLSSGL